MPYLLKVPYSDKDEAKGLGALWIADRKTWVIPDYISDLNPFKKWIPAHPGCIVAGRAPLSMCLSYSGVNPMQV
ncbi:DUF5710 domain-containing protein [Pedobacter hartonius]|uniref:DUF5710 domain-containing protein n=1 Tax=Pedobacter hartonius TaxID=425514 RepID=A0A1H4EW49_9SPHI|nr:DUF5710 domain-containing protein [Pedobacter hartonius]SEA88472.1 hypothetical protein SAMN05443550_106153 [Pedobacter hartonius]